jgi:hypothetical protein
MPRCRTSFRHLVGLLALGLTASPVLAQPQPSLPLPRLTIVTPPGAKIGTTVEVTLTGVDLEEPTGLLFSHPGLKAEFLPPPAPPPPDPKKPDAKPAPPGPPKFKVTVAGDAPLGVHDLRFVGKYGVSNPRAFVVGDLTEVLEKEPNNDVGEAQRVDLNSTINGVINQPTDVDYYVFAGKKGQRVVISCLADTIDSRAHPLLELFDANGKQIASNRNYHETDAVLDAVLPVDGDYKVRLCQFTYTQGGPEFFYRLSVSTAPWIDAVFPPVVEPGKPVQLTVYGRNLPGGQPDPTVVLGDRPLEKLVVNVNVPNDPAVLQRLTYSGAIAPPQSAADGFEYRLRNDSGSSNPVLLFFARSPVVLENGATGKRETAQELPVPAEVVGKLDAKKSVAWFTFPAKKGEVYSIELTGNRLGSPTDLGLVLYAADGKSVITELDDDPDTLSTNQFFTRTTDPQRFRFSPPADGKYQILVKAQEANFPEGPRHFYRLRVGPEQPDFRLVAIPTSFSYPETATLYQSGRQDYAIYVWRQDGWNGELALSIEGLPPGVTCKPQVVGTGLKSGTLVLEAAADAAPWAGQVVIKGTATINGQPVVREARSASLVWNGPGPQNKDTPTLTRLDRGLMLAVREKAPFAFTVTADKPVVTQGDKINLTFKLDRLWPDLKAPVAITAHNLVVNQMTVPPLTIAPDKQDGTAVVTINPTCPPGVYCLGFHGSAQFPHAKDAMTKQKGNITVVLPGEPVLVTVLPKQLATFSVNPPNPAVKIGATGDVVVKVARLYEFPGEFKIEVVLPANAAGVTAAPVTIPAGKDEAKLTFAAAADAAAGNRGEILVRATAMFNATTPVIHEVKINVNVVK